MIVLSLIQNFALLVALAALFQRIGARFQHLTLRYQVLSGLLFGAVGLVGMATPVHLLPGIIFDGRSIILAVAGIFGGPVVAGIAAIICATYRLVLGGAGAVMGLAVILEAAAIGVAAEAVRQRRGWPRGARFFLAVGVSVHVVMLGCVLALPGWAEPEVVARIGPSILVLYPLTTVFVCLLFQDFEDQVSGRAALHESEARYRELFLAHPLPMWAYDLETLRFLAVNDAMVERYGYSRAELLAMTIRDIRPAEDWPTLEASVAFSRAHPGYQESRGWRHRTKDGRVFEVEISSHDITFEGRQGRVVVAHDVSERRHLEGQLRQAQKMEAIGILAGGIAHDFNNLLQATLSAVQAAELQAMAMPGASPALEKTLAEIQAQVQRGAQLTRQLLLFSRQTPTNWQRFDLAALIGQQSSMLRRVLPETIALEVETDGAPLPIEADAGQLVQVLTNLVVNARDAMPAGGRVVVSAIRLGDEVILEVRDTGAGIPAEVRERMFDPFFTTKAPGKGTGLGLAVVWGIVKEHGGRIEVDSEVGCGSTFRIVLPGRDARSGGAPLAAAEVRDDLPSGNHERVLLVEDEEGARRGLTELLSMLSYRVTAVASSEEVSTLVGAPAFDVLLTDFRLPGVSGLDLARNLRERWPGLKVIVMSGYAPDDLASDLFASGTVHFLQKPFDMSILARVLRDVLRGVPGSAAS
ncbi:MAG: ATP-binding protein [Acidobacteriota bacterium]